jgi:hypothetical protein
MNRSLLINAQLASCLTRRVSKTLTRSRFSRGFVRLRSHLIGLSNRKKKIDWKKSVKKVILGGINLGSGLGQITIASVFCRRLIVSLSGLIRDRCNSSRQNAEIKATKKAQRSEHTNTRYFISSSAGVKPETKSKAGAEERLGR